MSGSQQLLLGGAPTVTPVDPYFYSVTSLLHGDGTNGGQNNTFLDSSTNNFTITRNGNTTQGSFSPFSQTGWGNYFGGSSDWINFASSSSLAFASDFTVEAWVYNNYTSGTFNPAVLYDSSSNAISSFEINNGTNFPSVAGITATNTVARLTFSGPSVALSQWVHVAWVRSSGVLKVYVNGIASSSTLSNSATTGQFVQVGNARSSGSPWNGYISNLRIVSSAVYTSNFTPSSTPLTAISGTQLLTCQANRFRDVSSNALAATINGAPSVQPFSPFNPITPYSTSSIGGSGYFDGSGDYLAITSGLTNQFDPGSAYTFEGWFYIRDTADEAPFYVGGSTVDWNASTGVLYQFYLFSTTIYWQFNSGGAPVSISGTAPAKDQWVHVAVGYNGTTTRMWVNGVSIGTSTSSYTVPTYTAVSIGAQRNGGAAYTGYASNLRFVKGTDVYGVGNTTITVPASLVTAISGTSLLLNFTNGAIFDNAAVADYETVGNAQISTSVKKYGTGSMLFDGTGDYLSTPFSQLCRIMGGDFTIEMWVYLNAAQANMGLVSSYSSNNGWLARLDTSAIVFGYGTGGAATVVSNSASLSTGVWYHLAFCKIGTSLKTYVNGTQVGTTATISGAVDTTATGLQIGRTHTTTNDFNGYIDDLRISNGVARYPYNFTPPTTEFPNIGGTVTLTADPNFEYTTLLLPGNGTNGAQNNTFLDSSTNNFSITRNGNTTQGTFSPFSQTGWGNYFDGNGDELTLSTTTAAQIGANDFSFECFVYATRQTNTFAQGLISYGIVGNTSGTSYASFQLSPSGNLNFFYADTSAAALADPSLFPINQWIHAVVCRSGSTLSMFVNGSRVATTTTSATVGSSGDRITIGGQWFGNAAGRQLEGYISNARIVKGSSAYSASSSTLTVPTSPLTAITNTSLLTCQSNRFIDNSTNAFAITRNGDVSVQAFSPFNPTAAWSASTNGGSGYFDGSGDYLTTASSTSLALGSGDFTVDVWFYPTTTNTYFPIDFRTGCTLYFYVTSGTTVNVAIGGNSETTFTGVVTNAWNHFACVRSGSGSNNVSYYLNGVRGAQQTDTTNFSSATTITLGKRYTAFSGNEFYLAGYLGSTRLVVGTAVYSGATYTVPTAPLTAIANTSLLCNFTNAGITDATSKNDLETVGNAQISTTQSKFGGSSMYFDGTGDWLRAPASPNLDMGTGDLTIEGWFYLTATVAVDYRMIVSDATNGNNYVAIRSGGTGGQLEINVNGTSFRLNLNNTVTINTWFHLAVVRYNGTWNGFVNGASLGTSAAAAAFNLGNGGTFVGRFGGATAYEWPGYIDDLRITKGIARYTSNFTPPTTAFLTL